MIGNKIRNHLERIFHRLVYALVRSRIGQCDGYTDRFHQ